MERKIVYIVGGLSAVGLTVVVGSWIKKEQYARRLATIRAAYPKDTVILHQIPRGPHAPSLSPFVVKLETFLRMVKVSYQNDSEQPMSTKGKTPWITLNGKDTPDSQFAINEIKKTFDVDVDSHLSTEQKAIGLVIRRSLEEAFLWIFACWRWQHGVDEEVDMMTRGYPGNMPKFMMKRLMKAFSKKFTNAAWFQGTGRHTPNEIWTLGAADLQAYSDLLGSNLYMLGSSPSEVDAAMFGFLSQVKWHMSEKSPIFITFNTLPNLSAYCDRMKDNFWPNWDECITHGGTKKATK